MRVVTCSISFLLVVTLVVPPTPNPAFALRGQALIEGDSSVLAGMEEDLGVEDKKRLVQAAWNRILQGDSAAQRLLRGVSIVPAKGKGVRVEGDRIFLGVEPGSDAKVLAQ